MMLHICNKTLENDAIFLLDFEKYLLTLNKCYENSSDFSLPINQKNTFSFNNSYLLNETESFFLIDFLFFVIPLHSHCRFCSFGYNQDTESIISKTTKRFQKNDFSLSPFEYEHILKNNLLSNEKSFNLFFDKQLNSWYGFKDSKKVLFKNPKLPNIKEVKNIILSLDSIPFELTQSLALLLAENLDILGFCPHCSSTEKNKPYNFYLKLTFFDAKRSNIKNIFLNNIKFENIDDIYLFLHKKRTT